MPSIARSVVLLLVAGVAAQDKPVPKPAELAADLSSETAVTVAWAASHAASAPAKELIAPLRKALHTWRDREGDEAEVTRLHLLDALLQSGAKVPASELLPLLDGQRTGTVAFVMLLREPKLNEHELFDLFRASPKTPEHGVLGDAGLRQVALGNILAGQKTPGFAMLVWHHLDLDLHVVAHEGRISSYSISAELPTFLPPDPRQGFPPEPVVRLVADDSWLPTSLGVTNEQHASGRLVQANGLGHKAQWLTTGGQARVGFVRVMRDEQTRWALPCARSEQGFLWLEMITPTSLQRSETGLSIAFKSRDSFLVDVVAARGKLDEHKKEALRALVASGAMTEAEAAAAADRTEVHVDDQRANRSEALPDIPPIK